MSATTKDPLRVTGYSVLSALGTTRDEHLDALRSGRSGLGPAPMELPFETSVGEVRSTFPDLPSHLKPRSTRIARMAAHLIRDLDEPLRRAREKYRPERLAVLLGTSTAGAERTELAYEYFVANGRFPDGYNFRLQHTFGAVLHVIADLSGFRGPTWMASTACTSSGKPFATAQRLIEADIIDAAIVGGLDTLCSMTLRGFQSLQALDYEPCRPFHPDRGGISIGEGGALALVERSGDARVVVSAVGETSDAYHISAPHPEGRGALSAMQSALRQAGRDASAIDHVNAHGTGTKLNDVAEAKAIAAVVDEGTPVISTKGYTGHTLGAAAAIEFAMVAMTIEEGWIPRSIGAGPIDPAISLNVPVDTVVTPVKSVLSNSFAFGGNNVCLLVEAP